MKIQKQSMLVLLACFVFLNASTARAVDVSTVSKLDARAVNKVQVRKCSDGYILDMDITVVNSNPQALKLRNGLFFAILETKEPPKTTNAEPQIVLVPVGKALIEELVIPGAGNDGAGTAVRTISVQMGPDLEETRERLVKLINVIGDPAAPMSLDLRGEAEVGVEVARGWVFEKGRTYEVDFKVKPMVQRDVLVK